MLFYHTSKIFIVNLVKLCASLSILQPEIREEQAQNFGPITFPRSRINQQRTEHVPIPGDFGSGLRLLVPDLDAGSSRYTFVFIGTQGLDH